MSKRWYVVHAYSSFEKHAQTAAERAGRLSGAPEIPAPVSLEKIRASLAFSMLL